MNMFLYLFDLLIKNIFSTFTFLVFSLNKFLVFKGFSYLISFKFNFFFNLLDLMT